MALKGPGSAAAASASAKLFSVYVERGTIFLEDACLFMTDVEGVTDANHLLNY